MISNPVNQFQRHFNEICAGGRSGASIRAPVQQLLHEASRDLNEWAAAFVTDGLGRLVDINPWHVCFAVGLVFGHLATPDPAFLQPAARLMANWNNDDLDAARNYYWYKGPDPLEQSLRGGWQLFQRVRLPDQLPLEFGPLLDAEQRWLSPVLSKNRPRYIGSWNSTAMFMAALFSRESLWRNLSDEHRILLPPGGPVYNGLRILHGVRLLLRPPSGTELDDEVFQPGALYENQALMVEIWRGHRGWSLVDVHSGLYLLGTRRQLEA